jgi:sugar lactone lactonase YvrE
MNTRNSLVALSLLMTAPLSTPAWASDHLPDPATFSTLQLTPNAIEGLTNDNYGNLYTPGRTPGLNQLCPVWRVNIASPGLVVVGNIPPPNTTVQCSPSGLAFDRSGRLYVTETDKIYRFTPNQSAPPIATLFASGVPGTNGLAFDASGNLWTGDGTTGQGRVWKITPAGLVTEMFRVQPMANSVGVGRSAVTLPPGTAQPLVANGVQFTKHGDLLIADTARGAIWRVELDRDGNVLSQTGCDTTFTANTLCLNNILVQHSLLEGIDGFVLDQDDNVWADANERNAVIFVSDKGEVTEVFRNPVDPASQLRNLGPLETPTSPALSNRTLCTANSDGNRRDNSPNTAGEISPAGLNKGKISCMDQQVHTRGATLPVR